MLVKSQQLIFSVLHVGIPLVILIIEIAIGHDKLLNPIGQVPNFFVDSFINYFIDWTLTFSIDVYFFVLGYQLLTAHCLICGNDWTYLMYNRRNNVMKQFKILVQVCIRVVSRPDERDSQVAKRIKTQDFRNLGNIKKISKLGGDRAQCPASLTEIKFWSQWPTILRNQISKFFALAECSLISLLCPTNFFRDCTCTLCEIFTKVIALKGPQKQKKERNIRPDERVPK